MSEVEIKGELVCIKQRLTAIETDLGWFKTLSKWGILGLLGIVGVDIAPYIMG